MAREGAQTLDRGLRLLEVLAERSEPATVTELSAALAVSRPVVYRLLTTLEAHGLAASVAGGGFRLGLGVTRLTGHVLPLLRAAAEPHLRALADDLGVTAHLTVADGDEAVAAVVVEPSSSILHVAYRAGTRHPLERGAAGQAILHARRGRHRRWYVTTGQLQDGATGLAVPLRHPGVEGSVGIVTMGRVVERHTGPLVVRAAALVRNALPGPAASPAPAPRRT